MKKAAVKVKEALGAEEARKIVHRFAERIALVQAHDFASIIAAFERRLKEHELALDGEFSHVEEGFRADARVDKARDLLLVALTAHVSARLDCDSSQDLRALLDEFQQAMADRDGYAHGF